MNLEKFMEVIKEDAGNCFIKGFRSRAESLRQLLKLFNQPRVDETRITSQLQSLIHAMSG
jgi:hypothetical protein